MKTLALALLLTLAASCAPPAPGEEDVATTEAALLPTCNGAALPNFSAARCPNPAKSICTYRIVWTLPVPGCRYVYGATHTQPPVLLWSDCVASCL